MSTDASCLMPPTRVSRRRFLSMAAAATGGLAGMLTARTPALFAATRTVTMLIGNHFVPVSDENLRTWGKEFEKANKCRVKIDFIAHRDTYVKIAKEHETHQGHDERSRSKLWGIAPCKGLTSPTPGKGGTLPQLHTWAQDNALYAPAGHGESCDRLRTSLSNPMR